MTIEDILNLVSDVNFKKPIVINGDCVAFMIKNVTIEDELIRLEVEEVVNGE